MFFKKKQSFFIWSKISAFTLVELLVAVSVIAVGMVFVIGALSRCVSTLDTAEKMVTATYLLNERVWQIDRQYDKDNGSIEGSWDGSFDEPYHTFSWQQDVVSVETDFGQINETEAVQKLFNEETVKVSWRQGRVSKDVSVLRYVKKRGVAE